MFKKTLILILAVVMISSFFVFVLGADSAEIPLRVTRGGTGVGRIPEGWFLIGSRIDSAEATSTISMSIAGDLTLTGSLITPSITVSAVSGGDLFVDGDIGIGTSTPATNADFYDTGTSTISIDTDAGNKGSCLKLRDSTGALIYCYLQSGGTTFTCSTVDCQ